MRPVYAIAVTSTFIGFIPLVLFLIRKKQRQLPPLSSYIAPYIWLTFIASAYELIGTLILKLNSDIWFRSYLLLEFGVLFYFFYKVFKKRYRPLFYFFGAVFLLTFIGLLFVWNDWSNLKTDSYLSLIEAIFVYTFVILWFKDVFHNLSEQYLWNFPLFYFISGFIFYFSGTLFLFLMGDLIDENPELNFEDFWVFNLILIIIKNIFLMVGIWRKQKK
ncbi:hypothetical protein [Flavobacterium cerinum]|uniref:Lycopene cyclase domain-containing protein n=1 Tax=Flavobacterium cerinum TaxID=2502784 RepID=A0ABY5IR93_9FLAO|nr:hypothetical protein [Flavobacterium cerinum]UUC43956.1 hypothetical protein NOX80_09950 [Flavobacterium cerinum]